jgi:hypothetical protein
MAVGSSLRDFVPSLDRATQIGHCSVLLPAHVIVPREPCFLCLGLHR